MMCAIVGQAGRSVWEAVLPVRRQIPAAALLFRLCRVPSVFVIEDQYSSGFGLKC